ncbi:serine/threonine protein kinase [Catelliglobosispora koreensis]|uniref:serine/threonine protein kinase n=1 Tax=Catelliglobosispora koreensis TaxID=129052 RepID=UPI0003A6DB72|nr:serine/threonine-protein kinase [Catelliglobosispora koreensis]
MNTADDIISTLPVLGIDLIPLGEGDPTEAGDIVLLGRIGEGGMGQVYLGTTVSGRPVAVKVVKAPFADDPAFRARFAREAAIAMRVNGIFTAPVLSHDSNAERPWLATAFVPGPSLAVAVARHGTFSADGVWRLAAGLAEALKAIHAAGITHRDLKPGNVLLASDGPRVIDFGISRAEDELDLTQTGMRMGTPSYMAPEQLRGERPTPAADVFSLGAVIAFAATGKAPFPAASLAELVSRVIQGEPDLSGITDPGLRTLAESCLDKDPLLRPAPQDIITAYTRRSAKPGDAWIPASLAKELTPAKPVIPEAASVVKEPAPKKRTKRRVLALAAAAAVVVVLTGVLFAVNGPRSGAPSAAGQSSAAVAPSSAGAVVTPVVINPGTGATVGTTPTPGSPLASAHPGPATTKPTNPGGLPNGPLNPENMVIVSAADDTVLSTTGTGDGAAIVTDAWKDQPGQRWKFEKAIDADWSDTKIIVVRSLPSKQLGLDNYGNALLQVARSGNYAWYYEPATKQIHNINGVGCLTANGVGRQATYGFCDGANSSQRWNVVS